MTSLKKISTYLGEGLFDDLRYLVNLQELIIHGGTAALTKDTFEPLTNIPIETLIIQNLNITNATVDFLVHFKALKTLVIRCLKPRNMTIVSNIFEAVSNVPSKSITTLHLDRLSREYSDSLPSDPFSSDVYKTVQRLSFSCNLYSQIDYEMFLRMPSLKQLRLSFTTAIQMANIDRSLNNVTVTNLSRLEVLDVSNLQSRPTWCETKYACRSPYYSIENYFPEPDYKKYHVEDVLKYPQYDQQSNGLHKVLHRVTYIYAQNSPLIWRELMDSSSSDFFNVQVLDLSHSNTMSLPYFANMAELKYLDLSSCRLTTVPDSISNISKLVYLDLSHNELNEMSNNYSILFNEKPILEYLYLDKNNIRFIPAGTFVNLISLKELRLEENRLSAFDFFLPNVYNLHISLKENQIHRFSAETMAELGQLSQAQNITIDCSGNVFACQCYTSDFVKWFQQTDTQLVNKPSYTCHYETTVTNMVDVNVGHLERKCSDYYKRVQLITLLVIIPIFIIIIMLVIILCCCTSSWTVSWYWFRFKQHIPCSTAYRNRREAEEQLRERMLYDVAVIYDWTSDQDKKWVTEILMPQLEQEWTMNVSIFSAALQDGHNLPFTGYWNDKLSTIRLSLLIQDLVSFLELKVESLHSPRSQYLWC